MLQMLVDQGYGDASMLEDQVQGDLLQRITKIMNS